MELPANLTKRERELYVYLTTTSLRNKEIAHRMGLTEATVKVYECRLYTKTGVSNNRIELMCRENQKLRNQVCIGI